MESFLYHNPTIFKLKLRIHETVVKTMFEEYKVRLNVV